MNDLDRLVAHCNNTLDLASAKLPPEAYYNSLPLAIIDAVFSIGVKYTSTQATVERYCCSFNLQRIRSGTDLPLREKQHTVSELIENIGISEHFATDIVCNSQRTSTRNGILKAEAVRQWAVIFQKYGIETLQDFNEKYSMPLELELRNVKGQHSGISLIYLRMLCGNDDFCKPDRHIIRFISEGIAQTITVETAQPYLESVYSELKATCPHLTIRLLDNVIWKYMSGRKSL